MEWSVLSKIDAASATDKWQQMNKADFDAWISDWDRKIQDDIPDSFIQLRKDVVKAYAETKCTIHDNAEYSKRKDYFTDLLFGIRFFQIMQQYGLSVRVASNDQVWMFLCVKVFPDIVYDRFPGVRIKTPNGVAGANIREDRYWKVKTRIYLKTLWWYIYLSVKDDDTNDLKLTFNMLEKNSTDEIVQLVERSGTAGYRVDVYREIMKYYSEHRDKYDNAAFRRVMVLNTAKTKVIEPALIDGGISKYVKELFDYVG